ncbi:MAG: hypothetical protein K2X93_21060 [Candidatus Obscuribacterales bacterium]|nr:hypothetical protein [Candidatus Obscuribacterales bacterium]
MFSGLLQSKRAGALWLELSPGILRDTFLYHQLSQRQSLKDVAYVGGYSRLSSLRRHIGIKAHK